ncbi:4Fe-4S dicluster domain-containing protein [Geovibrio thiophilus]|uniref:4Fe-4S dicluster domain-containing protein n=2 Tax=Geovibrio thiophilus TaxID=139438 RepID=A0A3R5XYM6_9BACT|nr:4Fe-4S dicluster domain-containing protein [Geovibrio thiophilus]
MPEAFAVHEPLWLDNLKIKGSEAVIFFDRNKRIGKVTIISRNTSERVLSESTALFDTAQEIDKIVKGAEISQYSKFNLPQKAVLRIADRTVILNTYSEIIIGEQCNDLGNGICIYIDRCIGCEECSSECSFEAITIVENTLNINPEKCVACYACVGICPTSAIVLC